MKPHIFLLLVCTISIGSPGQSYHKLVRTNTTWDEYIIILPNLCYTSADRVYFPGIDTVINGKTYSGLFGNHIFSENPGPEFCPPFEIWPDSYQTGEFFREDTVAKKVWLLDGNSPGGMEQLLYDFSLLPGDTLKSELYYALGDTMVVESVSDWILANGEVRKKFTFFSNWDADHIESIGGNWGLFQLMPYGFYEADAGYFCVKEDSEVLLDNMCDIYYVGEQVITGKTPSLSPNPAHDKVIVTMPWQNKNALFEVLDLQGRTLITERISYGTNTIRVSRLHTGIYFYRITSPECIYSAKLTIIN